MYALTHTCYGRPGSSQSPRLKQLRDMRCVRFELRCAPPGRPHSSPCLSSSRPFILPSSFGPVRGPSPLGAMGVLTAYRRPSQPGLPSTTTHSLVQHGSIVKSSKLPTKPVLMRRITQCLWLKPVQKAHLSSVVLALQFNQSFGMYSQPAGCQPQ